jgi:2-polyprenyl-6-methoxyphenol hydroxylase-like FAD-dependent oxidoreductase
MNDLIAHRTQRALIIGGGIAGPAVALFLKRAGIEAEIFEARSTPEGYALSLSSNGLGVLKALGLDGAVLAAGFPISTWTTWNSAGKRLGGGTLTGRDLTSVFIKRVPLGMILSDAAERQGTTIHRGKKLRSIETPGAGGVVATFEDGSRATGDILIGCDGVHSHTRHVIAPGAPDAVYTGLMNTGGYTHGLPIPPTPEAIHFIFGKRAFFGYHRSATGEIYWFVNEPRAQLPSRDALDHETSEDRSRRLIELFGDAKPFVREIIAGAETIFPDFPSYALPRQPPSWHTGPVVLAGDAVHAISPSSGQGAAMALEDAAILAKCLRDIPDRERAFATYEHLRRSRTTKMYELGVRQDAGKFAAGPVRRWWRDLATPVFLALFANVKASEWIYSYEVAWDEPVCALREDHATHGATE